MIRSVLITFAVSVVALAAVACGSSDEPTPSPIPGDPTQPPTEATPTVPPESPVVRVNGDTVTRAEFDMRFAQAADSYASDGTDTSSPEFQTQLKDALIERLVDEVLLLQGAEEEGITADPGEVERMYGEAKGQFPSDAEFQARLAELHMTPPQLRENIAESLTIDAYVTFHLENNVAPEELEPTEAELRQIYDAQVEQLDGKIPTFEEVRPNIEPQVRQQKRSEQVAKLIESLEAESEVEILI